MISSAALKQQQQRQQPGQQQCRCTPRLTFWIAAGISWLVWIFAVAAGADDKWMRDESSGEGFLAAAEDGRLNFCDGLDDNEEVFEDSCAIYRAFTAMQIIATIACSVSVVLLSLAFFRPSVGVGGCSSPRSLAFVGGALMATYALFQLIAVVLGGTFKQELNSIADEVGAPGIKLGPTFGVAVTGLILAVVVSVLLLLFARHTGDGPLHECCHSLMLANMTEDNGSPAILAGPPPGSKPKPGPAAAATAAAAPHHYEEEGAVPLPQAATAIATEITASEQQQSMSPPPYDQLPPAVG